MALSAAEKKRIEEEEAYRAEVRAKNQPDQKQTYGFPALLSFFLPGLGQIIKGQVGRGIIIFIATGIGYAMLVIPGLIIHIWQIADAYNKPA